MTSIKKKKNWVINCIRDWYFPFFPPLFLTALFAFQKYNDILWMSEKAYCCPRLRAERMNALEVECWSQRWGRKQLYEDRKWNYLITSSLLLMFVFSIFCSIFFFSEETYSFHISSFALLVFMTHYSLKVYYYQQKMLRSSSWLL